jgi:hypothetical protein
MLRGEDSCPGTCTYPRRQGATNKLPSTEIGITPVPPGLRRVCQKLRSWAVTLAERSQSRHRRGGLKFVCAEAVARHHRLPPRSAPTGALSRCGASPTDREADHRERLDSHSSGRAPEKYGSVRALVARQSTETKAKISAKRQLPTARAGGYARSDRKFRQLVAQELSRYRQRQAIARSRRRAVWAPGEHPVIDW